MLELLDWFQKNEDLSIMHHFSLSWSKPVWSLLVQNGTSFTSKGIAKSMWIIKQRKSIPKHSKNNRICSASYKQKSCQFCPVIYNYRDRRQDKTRHNLTCESHWTLTLRCVLSFQRLHAASFFVHSPNIFNQISFGLYCMEPGIAPHREVVEHNPNGAVQSKCWDYCYKSGQVLELLVAGKTRV